MKELFPFLNFFYLKFALFKFYFVIFIQIYSTLANKIFFLLLTENIKLNLFINIREYIVKK